MGDRQSRWLLLPEPIREFPIDLAVMVALLFLMDIFVFIPVINEGPPRVIFSIIFSIFVPGYVLIAALFPKEGGQLRTVEQSTENENFSNKQRSGINWLERVALSFGLSVAIVPVIVLIVSLTPWGTQLVPILVSLNVFTLFTVSIASFKRQQVLQEDRFYVPYQKWIINGRNLLFGSTSHVDTALTFILVCSIALGLGSVGYAISTPEDSETYSTVSILTETNDGELVAGGFPEEIPQGDSREFVLSIDNQEQQTVNYTVVIIEQDIEVDDNNNLIIEDQKELQRAETRLDDNDTWYHNHEITPTIIGNNTRILWLLYVHDVPSDPTPENAEYTVHHSITVNDSLE
ncbi:DUF1616 domain-containing protein [Halomontanus rarus]|uniref:DUF1616 domain-containing protein n=1 Tax=Halomontanus rarus TaxID=3034020 RepID=UPI0023E842C3|nr:DUF1616 domain-containing protein [Halovivax sp. TS33]